jgi:hypothetical protein
MTPSGIEAATLAQYLNHRATISGPQTAYIDMWKKYRKTACTNLPEDEHLDVRNMSKKI